MKKIFWALAIIGSFAGGLILIWTIFVAQGALQQEAGAAIAVALAVIPYCFARSIQLFDK